MKILVFIAAIVFAAQPVVAEELSLDTKRSLASMQTDLEALTAPSGTEVAALAAVTFLRAIEVAMQERYRTNAYVDNSMISIPILRLPVPPNPDPDPFEPSDVTGMFERVDDDMDRVRAAIAKGAMSAQDKLVVDVAALWFDVNADGKRDTGEGAMEFIGAALAGAIPVAPSGATGGPDQAEVPSEGLIVHFDAADVEWLAAYTHLLSAFSELVLAFDPTEAISEILSSKAAMADVKGDLPTQTYGWFTGNEELIDAFATIYGSLNRVPDSARTLAARDHFLKMIERNRAFWALVYEETDNSFEWIPNDEQEAALGFDLPLATGIVWQRVLSDAEAVLKGELLVPHWRTEPGGGVNVAKLVENPPAFDIVTWIQGAGLVPYMEKGQLVHWESFMRFREMFWGNAMLYMVLLN